MPRILKISALRAPVRLHSSAVAVHPFAITSQFTRYSSSAPSVTDASFWKSLVPKPFRSKPKNSQLAKPKSKEWNPATFFIVLFLFIGSMAIQMIALKKNFNTYMRRADVRVGLLQEVVEKLQRGEEVDVEKALGTGDEEKELQWEQVIKELEREEILSTPKPKKRRQRKTPSTESTPTEDSPPTDAETNNIETPTSTDKGGYSSFF